MVNDVSGTNTSSYGTDSWRYVTCGAQTLCQTGPIVNWLGQISTSKFSEEGNDIDRRFSIAILISNR